VLLRFLFVPLCLGGLRIGKGLKPEKAPIYQSQNSISLLFLKVKAKNSEIYQYDLSLLPFSHLLCHSERSEPFALPLFGALISRK